VAEQPLLSIIITSYTTERLKDIFELLDSIKAQTYPNIETIFVAERSRELYGLVEAYMEVKAIPSVRLLFNHGEPGLSAARNLGIKEARGDIIAFVDDDTLLFPDWAEEMVKTYENGAIIGVTGPALPLWEDESMSWFPEEFYWIISCTAWCDWNEMREVRNAWGMNMSFKREVFELCGPFQNEFGFHRGPMAEDNEFSLRVRVETGKGVVYNPSVKLGHRVHRYRLSWRFIRERAYWIGHSRRMLKKLYPEANSGTDLLSQEHQLLKRIFTRLPLDILKSLFRHPAIAWRKFSVTFIALFFVTLGYYSYLFTSPFGHQELATRGSAKP
jgi:glycosyltransferase involved in cell wall biosynthesis